MKKRIILIALATVMLFGGCSTPSTNLREKKTQTVSEDRVNKGEQDVSGELGEEKISTNEDATKKGN